MTRLDTAFRMHGKQLIERLENSDINKDGMINIDGFQAALRMQEVGMSNAELSEVFFLICNHEQELQYKSWIVQRFPQLRDHFTIHTTVTPREFGQSTIRRDESQTILDSASHLSISANLPANDPVAINAGMRPQDANSAVIHEKYLSAKRKVEKYILSQDLNIGMMFAIMDTNSDSEI